MTKWAQENIQLLIKQRCSKLLTVALQILDGLSSFNGELIGTSNWPSAPPKHIPIFLLKLYFSNEYINTTKLTQYLEMSTEEILLLGTRIILNLQTDEEAKALLDSFNLTDIDPEDPIESGFITEMLDQFNSILTITTINLWSHHEKKTKANTAVSNLKNKMELLKTVTATTSTALAINKAIENANTTQTSDRQSHLRLANLEKAERRQEHKSNEIFNKLNDKKQKKTNRKPYHRVYGLSIQQDSGEIKNAEETENSRSDQRDHRGSHRTKETKTLRFSTSQTKSRKMSTPTQRVPRLSSKNNPMAKYRNRKLFSTPPNVTSKHDATTGTWKSQPPTLSASTATGQHRSLQSIFKPTKLPNQYGILPPHLTSSTTFPPECNKSLHVASFFPQPNIQSPFFWKHTLPKEKLV
jgi:hypothetical protein